VGRTPARGGAAEQGSRRLRKGGRSGLAAHSSLPPVAKATREGAGAQEGHAGQVLGVVQLSA
jgi:hypothetical protein